MKRSRTAICCAAVLLLSACGGTLDDVDLAPAQEDDVTPAALAEQEYSGGFYIAAADSGFVALEVFSTTYGGFYAFCSGTLVRNKYVVTAKHCVEPIEPGRGVWARMGDQRILVSWTLKNSDWDVALLKLTTGMNMWNWWGNGWKSSVHTKNKTDYKRDIYAGTNESLDGMPTYCFGYAPVALTHQLRRGRLQMSYTPVNGRQPLNQIHITASSTGQMPDPGDSGGGCTWTTTAPTYGFQLAYVQSGNMGTEFGYGPGAASFRSWVLGAIEALELIDQRT